MVRKAHLKPALSYLHEMTDFSESPGVISTTSDVAVVNPLAPLPDDLILEICEHLFAGDRHARKHGSAPIATKTFAALALTCRYLYAFGMRFLYHTYHATSRRPTNNFLRAIHCHPDLASKVREIIIDDCGVPPRRLGLHPWEISIPAEKLEAEVRNLCLPYGQEWVTLLSTDAQAIELALLIFKCRHSLRSLEIPYRSDQQLQWFAPLAYASQQQQEYPKTDYGFEKLRKLNVNLHGLSVDHLSSIMLLSSIRDLKFSHLDINPYIRRDHIVPWSVAPRSSNINSLHIRHSRIPATLVSRILASCRAISDFLYAEGSSYGNTTQWHSGFFEALSQHANTIQKVHLDLDSDENWPRTTVLATFKVLKTLRTNYSILVGKHRSLTMPASSHTCTTATLRSLLPPTLEELSLCYKRSVMSYGMDYNEGLKGLITNDTKAMPRLRKYEIDYIHDNPESPFPLHLDTLQRHAKLQACDFTYSIKYYAASQCRLLS